MLFSIEAVIDKIEGSSAVLEIASNPKIKLERQELLWPKEKLPPNVKEGDVVSLGLVKKEDAASDKEEAAKNMLNALLKKAEESDD